VPVSYNIEPKLRFIVVVKATAIPSSSRIESEDVPIGSLGIYNG